MTDDKKAGPRDPEVPAIVRTVHAQRTVIIALRAQLMKFLDLVPRMSDADPIAPALAEQCREAWKVLSMSRQVLNSGTDQAGPL